MTKHTKAGVGDLGSALFVIVGLVGYLWGLAILWQGLGVIGVAVGFVLFPATITLAPLGAGLAWGEWDASVVVYGGTVVAWVLMGLGSRSDED